MNPRLTRSILVFTVLLSLVGCAKHFVNTDPAVIPVRTQSLPAIQGKGDVSVASMQAASEILLVSAGAWGSFYANTQQWTDTTVSLTKTALQEKGFHIATNAPKSLKLSIPKAGYDEVNAFYMGVFVTLRVEAGNGYIQQYEGKGTKYAGDYISHDWAGHLKAKSEHALTKAVELMLRDPKIIAYLAGAPGVAIDKIPAVTATADSQALSGLSVQEINGLFSGKLVTGKHSRKGNFQHYFASDGRLIGIQTIRGRTHGTWRSKDHELCLGFMGKREKCRQIRRDGSELILVDENNNTLVVFMKFEARSEAELQ